MLILAAAYLLGVFLFWRSGRREGFSSDDLFDLLFFSSLAGLLGGRVLFLFFAGGIADPTALLKIGEGFLWAGALAAATIASYLFTRVKKWSFFRVADLAAPALAFGQAVGFFTFSLYFSLGYLGLGALLMVLRKRFRSGIPFFVYLFFSGLAEIFWGESSVNFISGQLLVLAGIVGAIALWLPFWLKRKQ